MFTRIYAGLLLSSLAAALACYIYFETSFAERRAEYVAQAMGGPLSLIVESANQYPDVMQDDYFDILSRLFGFDFQEAGNVDLYLDHEQKTNLFEKGLAFYHFDDDYTDAMIFLGGKVFKVRIPEIAEQQFRGHALLLKNEILSAGNGSVDTGLVKSFQKYANYPLMLRHMDDMQLVAQQQSRLKQGTTVVSYDGARSQYFQIYVPMGNGQILRLGPIPEFDFFPYSTVINMLIMTGFILVATAYALVRRLDVQLGRVARAVTNFGAGDFASRIHIQGNDAIKKLADRVNAMADQIEALLQGQRDITQAVSHELRTPLSRIKFRLADLDADSSNQDITKKVDDVGKDIDELEDLIDEVLTFHKLDQGLEFLPLSNVDLNFMVQQLIDNVSVMYPHHNVEINLDEHIILSNVYKPYIHRLLQNLLLNAFKHSREKVAISGYVDADRISLKISDDGSGIPESDWQHIFTPFYRVDSSRNKQTGGYGLGLAIVSRIVKLYEGTISVDHASLGGACFTVLLPKRVSQAA